MALLLSGAINNCNVDEKSSHDYAYLIVVSACCSERIGTISHYPTIWGCVGCGSKLYRVPDDEKTMKCTSYVFHLTVDGKVAGERGLESWISGWFGVETSKVKVKVEVN